MSADTTRLDKWRIQCLLDANQTLYCAVLELLVLLEDFPATPESLAVMALADKALDRAAFGGHTPEDPDALTIRLKRIDAIAQEITTAEIPS